MLKVEQTFEVGKLYQVYYNKKWIIASFLRTIEQREEKYSNVYFEPKMEIGPERTRTVPRTHYWQSVVNSNTYATYAKDTQTRPVTDECISEINRLKDEIAQNDRTRVLLLHELKVLTL